jgi:hypothetical protein
MAHLGAELDEEVVESGAEDAVLRGLEVAAVEEVGGAEVHEPDGCARAQGLHLTD